MRVLICVAYDGTDFCGWQLQPNVRTVEGELNKALSSLFGQTIEVIGASRTDAGVHALSNMAVFDVETTIPADKICMAVKRNLSADVEIVWSKEVAKDFHPRHRLTEKTYEYTIWNGKFWPPTERRYSFFESRDLDIEAMKEAAAFLVGEHDFKAFSCAATQVETTVRNVCDITVDREGDKVLIDVTGNGFLYNMVRIISGTLLWVGLGVRTPGDVKEMLNACDRSLTGPTLPAAGLMLKSFKFLE